MGRTGIASVTAPAGARADPDGHMMSLADQAGRVCRGEVSAHLLVFASVPQGSVSAAP